jgi:tRNA G18 (ribose-2'-O)-methylase SpoU
MAKRPHVGRPRTSPLTRTEQLRAAKRAQRERQKAAGIKAVEMALEERQAARLRAAAASPHFRKAFDQLLGEMAVERTAWPVLGELTWNRTDAWIPADEALALYERNWRHVDPARLGKDEAQLIQRLADRFGGGYFNG